MQQPELTATKCHPFLHLLFTAQAGWLIPEKVCRGGRRGDKMQYRFLLFLWESGGSQRKKEAEHRLHHKCGSVTLLSDGVYTWAL